MSEFSRLTRTERSLTELIAAFLFKRAAPARRDFSAGGWVELIEAAERHHLAPLCYQALKEDRSTTIPRALLERLRLDLAQSAASSLIAAAELTSVLDAFASAQIPAVVLKGAALSSTLYPDPSLRPIGDLDLLIPAQCLPEARGLVLARGYASSPAMSAELEQFAFEEDFFRGGKTPAQLDLHWHVLESGYFRSRTPIEWFWKHTESLFIGSHKTLTLDPAAHLLYLAAHNVLQHRGEGLKWSLDVALIVERHRDRIDWQDLLDATARFGLTLPLRTAASMAREIWGVHFSEPARQRLERMQPSRVERLVYNVTTAPHSELRFLVNGLAAAGARGKAAVLFRLAFPRPEFMREQYHIRHSLLLPLYYGLRAGQSIARLVRSGASLAGR